MALFRKNNRKNEPEEELGFLIDQVPEPARVKLPDVYISDLAQEERPEKRDTKAEAKAKAEQEKKPTPLFPVEADKAASSEEEATDPDPEPADLCTVFRRTRFFRTPAGRGLRLNVRKEKF